ncbi:ankyrin repeat domain-containing protein [Salmonella enterica subsp. salamae]|uniref:Ankyrin repeat domain-containing protein n=1 Tax=Salmonella enterica TaxID=28901 RepID=A0A402XLH7_SALER|nr:ankyrin repeat domain-containing protein [Salmonella enterica]ECF6029876.1 ankyrin repeat domain-containing protein [Salmonella enterica subsp. salamae serovar Greenside]EEI3462222.1 ankyrin repeat domain-containing protein [Salmonella enterica subsp. salamae]HCM1962292.1 ankyrin repeat domain-containing protein [Salmonella enterica subsp. salamae serovar 56:l,v:z39]HCM1974570.1 ankyrin repeat domain-containing protein [Salmonella enterica subsp. salamae serovar 52:z:z39]EAQ6500143.1 ankyri
MSNKTFQELISLKKKISEINSKELFEKYQKNSEFWDVPIKDINQHGVSGDTMLHIAAWQGNVEDINKLILLGANVNSIGDLGNTPLHQAVLSEQTESIKNLLKHDVSIGIINESGEKALDIAKRNGRKEIIDLITKQSNKPALKKRNK